MKTISAIILSVILFSCSEEQIEPVNTTTDTCTQMQDRISKIDRSIASFRAMHDTETVTKLEELKKTMIYSQRFSCR